MLLNGRRISSFAEIRDLPTEAIARVDILPEEVALKYGYRADQKVVNFVLRRRFRALTAEVGDQIATEGGRNTPDGTLDILNINRDSRLQHPHRLYAVVGAARKRARHPAADRRQHARSAAVPHAVAVHAHAQFRHGLCAADRQGVDDAQRHRRLYRIERAAGACADAIRASAFVIGQRNTSLTYHLGGTANGDFGSTGAGR